MSAQVSPAASDGATVRLSIPAKAEYIALVRLALSGLSQLRPLNEEDLGDLKLAVTEACSNSVRHGYGDGEGVVDMLYELQPDRFVDRGRWTTARASTPRPARSTRRASRKAASVSRSSAPSPTSSRSGAREAGKGSRLRFVKFLDR